MSKTYAQSRNKRWPFFSAGKNGTSPLPSRKDSIEFHCGPASSDSPLALSPGGCRKLLILTSQPARRLSLRNQPYYCGNIEVSNNPLWPLNLNPFSLMGVQFGAGSSLRLTHHNLFTQNLFPDRIAIIDSTNNQYHSALHAVFLGKFYLVVATDSTFLWFEASHPCGFQKNT